MEFVGGWSVHGMIHPPKPLIFYGFRWNLWVFGFVRIRVHPPKPLDFLWISVEFVGFWVCTNYGPPTESIEFLMDLGKISYGFRWNSWVAGSVHLMVHHWTH